MNKFNIGEKVMVVGNMIENDEDNHPYHYFKIGEIVEVVRVYGENDIEAKRIEDSQMTQSLYTYSVEKINLEDSIYTWEHDKDTKQLEIYKNDDHLITVMEVWSKDAKSTFEDFIANHLGEPKKFNDYTVRIKWNYLENPTLKTQEFVYEHYADTDGILDLPTILENALLEGGFLNGENDFVILVITIGNGCKLRNMSQNDNLI